VDTIDEQILRLLTEDARMSWADLAAAVNLSAPSVADRVKKLEERAVLRAFRADVDPKAVGCGLTAFVAASVAGPRERAAFLARVHAMPEVLECHHVAGDDDYLVKVRCRDTDDLERILTKELKAHDGVARTRTTIVLSTVKETNVPPPLVARERKGKRV
jgi:Lrp/AsnC family leucine-responsive transcriptional regulator